MQTITLKTGEEALVDDKDYEGLVGYVWYAEHRKNGCIYVRRPSDGSSIYMHRAIMGIAGPRIDHRNHNGLDNRRENLRVCTPGQNLQNQRAIRGGMSKFKGVSWDKRRQKWRANIRTDGKQTHLGLYQSEEDAARIYDAAARQYFGMFACLNFPDEVKEVASTLQQYKTYKGVEEPRPGRWRARVRVNNKLLHLGTFDSPEEAAAAYDAAARFYYGPRARCNFD